MLGSADSIDLGFTYKDGDDRVEINQSDLLKSLSQGERKALYVLNVIFEIETRKKARQETLIIVDDIADSFDYQNKYAIVQYLKEISHDGLFKQIILTHNFDFLRTIESLLVSYEKCLIAQRGDNGITVERLTGIKNVFVNDWKDRFYTGDKEKIASIPFLRNLIEYSRGDNNPDYLRLTSMLHQRSDSDDITVAHLDEIFKRTCNIEGNSTQPDRRILDVIGSAANECLKSTPGLSLINKVVLSIAIRVGAERFIIGKIADPEFVSNIKSNQTQALIDKFKKDHSSETTASGILDKVALMTPQNIHLNAFMYEPIIDMGEQSLRALYQQVRGLA